MKTEAMSIKEFMSRGKAEKAALPEMKVLGNIFTAAGSIVMVITPQMVSAAAAADTFGRLHASIMSAIDSGVVLVVIFAGVCWCLGHRGKAIEILMGVCCGYLLSRHAIDIRDFLRSI